MEARLAGGHGTSGNPVVTHAYDGYGNRTATTDPRGCTTTTAFEAEQVYPASATTCLGHTTTFAHDARFGMRTSLTDPNGQTTTSTYDVFGRLTRVTGPFDTGSTHGSVSTFYENLGSPSAQRIVTYRTEQHGTGSVLWSAQYFDGLGRVYKTEAEGPGGQVIVSETTFDSRGLVAQRSAPRFTAEGALWTTLSYDALGRPVQVRHPDSTLATTNYALSAVAGAVSQVAVTDERGTVRRRHLTAHGQVLRVEEVNGTETYATTYQYDAAGALAQVTDHAGRVTTMTYDALGRKGAVQDPNMGSWTYGYDVTGNLTSQTDARGQTLSFTYDLQGRILTKAYPGGAQIQWTYDDAAVAYSRGRLTRVDDLAVSTRFTYNALGRVTQTVRLLDGTSYVMSQSYDALGRVVTQTFPDSETVTYAYNEAGWLSAVPGYVTSLTYNARGQRTQMQAANGVIATWTYDPTTFRLSQAQAANGATALQNLSYAYDAGGLITGITDSLWTGSRTFAYDPLGRLLSASGPFGPLSGGLPAETAQTYSYDATGNILSRAGITYTYADPLHPAAVTALSTGSDYSYDVAGNMLTGAGRALSWDADSRLAAVTVDGGNTATFAYDYTGMRVRKQTASGTLRSPFAGYEEDSTGVRTKYLFLGLERVALKRSTGETHLTFWYHNDHLGGVNLLTDATGARVQLTEYSPWGWITRSEGTVDLTHRFIRRNEGWMFLEFFTLP
ncbi:MAG: RHS repeat protein [Candidatus Rokubacteria bacterium]|nr:RHS repeat protein [Candidatus Rokubacteria bacterium]